MSRNKISVFFLSFLMLFIPLILIFTLDEDIKPSKLAKTRDKKPLILIWTMFFSRKWPDTIPKMVSNSCSCHVTFDRSKFNQSSAVLFTLRDLDIRDWPRYHIQNQKFVLYNLEPPIHSWSLSMSNQQLRKAMKESFDWTMTYRSDSDVYIPYGYIYQRPINTSWNPRKDLLKDKHKEVAWFVSNCHTGSKRETFVKQLAAYIPLDIYGRCGDKKCSDRKKCYTMLEKDYKFYLSFENSICKEYITEKVFNILQLDIIPVVFGYSSDNYKLLPPHSFIDALSFSSPAKLASYLKLLSQNETLYLSYLNWKRDYIVESHSHVSEFCTLCDKLIQDKNGDKNVSTNQSKRDLVKWWFQDSNCTSWKKSLN